MDALLGHKLCQIAFVVNNIETVARAYAEVLNVSMSDIIESEPFEESRAEYNGKPCYGRVKMAFFRMGHIAVEIMEPDKEPSIWRDYLDKYGEGIHHIAFTAKDYEEVKNFMESRGMLLIQTGVFSQGKGRYAYFDTKPKLGVLYEFLF